MKAHQLLPVALAAFATAQDSGDTPSLAEALASQNDTLSALNGLLQAQPDLVDTLTNLENITILAPSNEALESFLNNTEVAAMVAADPSIVPAILSYHVLNGTYYASNVTDTAAFIPTLLTNATYSNVTGGQVVSAIAEGDTVSFYSALKQQSNVTEANLNFTGGTIHIINQVLAIPMNVSSTAVAAELRSLVGAVTQADLATTLDTLEDVTIFAPYDEAFAAIGSVTGELSEEQLSKILTYHVVQGTVGYSSGLMNMSLETVEGSNLTITVGDDGVFVNSAKVIIPDVLVANGVVHVIDGVLNPDNAEATANPSTTTPAFSGASTATDGAVPFTSGVPTVSEAPTNLAPEETGSSGGGAGGDSEGETSTDAGPRATAAVAMGVLFGGAAIALNNF
jgi:uncharacterized surface protein with fasciclin (FAS1) repeats